MNNENNIIGRRINTVLAEKNIKQKDLASALGVTDNTISYFVSGKRTPNTEQIIKIAKFLDVSSDYLLGLSSAKSTNEIIQKIHKYTGLDEVPIMCLHDNYELVKQSKRFQAIIQARKNKIKEIANEFQNEFGVESDDELFDDELINEFSEYTLKEANNTFFRFLNALILSPKLLLASKYAKLYCVSKKGISKKNEDIAVFGSDIAEFRYQKCFLDMLNDFFENDEFSIDTEDENADD